MRYAFFVLTLYIILSFSSCVTVDDGVDLFFMGEDSIQYFFPSREWLSPVEGVKIESDWLYRNFTLENEEGGARTILNLSLYSNADLYRTVPEQIRITSGEGEIVIPGDQIALVYLDRGKTRYSSWFYSDYLDKIMRVTDTEMFMTLEFDNDLLFTSTPEFIPQIEYFQEVLLGMPLK